jgi:hypothetical protein
MRTTIDIDDPVLRDLKKLQRQEGKTLGRLVSDLLARAIAETTTDGAKPPAFRWKSKPMGARIDLSGHAELLDVMDDRGR